MNLIEDNNISHSEKDIFTFLYDKDPKIHNRSRENLKNLLDIYHPKSMISFIGAGVSTALGISDWKTLMEKLYNKAKNKGLKCKFPEDNPDQWPKLAQEIFNYLDNNEFYSLISENMEPKISSTSLPIIKLVFAFDIHLTTNFDNSIEGAYKFLKYLSKFMPSEKLKKEYIPYYIPDFKYPQEERNKDIIYYLHGSVNKNIYILKQKDYESFYPSVSESNNIDKIEKLEDFLKYCYENFNIIFIGFSFDDKYVRDYFFYLAKIIEKEYMRTREFYKQSGQHYSPKEIKHFWIVESGKLENYGEKIHEFFLEANIYPIVYKEGKHIFLEYLFEKLSEKRLGKIYERNQFL